MAATTTTESVPCFIFCGARGADKEWRERARALGHRIDTSLPRDKDLEPYRTQTIAVGRALGRTFPTSNTYIDDLLMRNIKAASKTHAIYAVGYLDNEGRIAGGTAWACMAMIARHDPTDALYFFDQGTNSWMRWNEVSFTKLGADMPPKPRDTWLGIGSRDLSSAGLNAIRTLWT